MRSGTHVCQLLCTANKEQPKQAQHETCSPDATCCERPAYIDNSKKCISSTLLILTGKMHALTALALIQVGNLQKNKYCAYNILLFNYSSLFFLLSDIHFALSELTDKDVCIVYWLEQNKSGCTNIFSSRLHCCCFQRSLYASYTAAVSIYHRQGSLNYRIFVVIINSHTCSMTKQVKLFVNWNRRILKCLFGNSVILIYCVTLHSSFFRTIVCSFNVALLLTSATVKAMRDGKYKKYHDIFEKSVIFDIYVI